MGTSRTTGFSHLLAPGLREIFFNKYGQWPDEYAQVFNVGSSTRSYEEDAEVVGLGKMVTKAEGTAITYDDPFQSTDKKRYTHTAFGLGFRVTEEMYSDDMYGIIKKMPASLSRSAKQTTEVEAWNIFNNAFGTTNTGLDGVALCSTAHLNVKKTGGPYSNRLATDSDLSVTSLQAAIELMEDTTDDRDMNIMLKPKLLIVTPSNKWMARELLNSEKKPHTADNEINALMDEELKYMVGHYLTDDDAWFLVTDKSDHTLNFFWRKKPAFDNSDDFDTGDAKFKASMRFSVGFTGWRGIIGTPGA
ncbi:MAG TPA: Mu-like prophage major head subunit gpT family protein [Candidatus Paceibacterota bacterium]